MRLLLLLVAMCSTAHAADGELRLGLGYAINNNTPARSEVESEGYYRGQLYDISAVWHHALGNADAQIAWTYIAESDFGTEQAVTATLLKRSGPLQYGAGLILGYTQSYESWQREYTQPVPVVGPRQCIFCGITAQIAYEYGRGQVQLRYWRTDFNLYPGHNGAMIVATWRL